MAYNVKNIIVGAASLYVSVKDSTDSTFYGANGQVAVALPTLTANTSAVPALEAATTAWRHLGYTTDGVEFSYEPDFSEVEVDQLLDAAKMFKTGMTASVNTTLAEATLENLVLAWGQAGSTLGAPASPDTTGKELGIAAGALLDEPVERSLVFVGPAPRNATSKKQERLYHVRRALNVEASSHSLSKTDSTTIPVSLRVLPDPYYSGKEYGIIRDRQIEA
jgi:hypothetical protein